MLKSILILGVVCLSLAAAPPQPHQAVAPKAAHVLKTSSLANPHLHGAKAAVTPAKPGTHSRVARHWRRRWSFADWAVLHRGTGTVMGEVRSNSSSAVAGARVVLRKPGGASFRSVSMKHVVHTNSSGTFIMHHVRIGSYRVHSEKGKAHSHVNIHVHGGTTAMANVKI